MKPHTTTKTIAQWLLATAGMVLAASSIACSDEPIEDLQTRIDCSRYCAQAENCNGDVKRSECEDDCKDQLDDCQDDEVDEVQDKLDECAQETCDDFTGCTIEAGAQCYFGI